MRTKPVILSIVSALLISTILLSITQPSLIIKPNALLYIPWRETYNPQRRLKTSCIFCTIPTTSCDFTEYILYRGTYHYVILNTNPYVSNGFHLLLIPYQHGKYLHNLSRETLAEMSNITHKICTYISSQAYEIQINYNIGANANASIPEHLHQHIICDNNPRQYNLIDVLNNTPNPQENIKLYNELLPIFTAAEESLPLIKPYHDASCYYCSVLQANSDEKEFIIYRGKYMTVLLNHYPFCEGEIIIIPNHHYTNLETLPNAAQQEMGSFMMHFYPKLLSLLNMSDISLGMISYGKRATDKNHVQFVITPRAGIPTISPILRTHCLTKNIISLYLQLVEIAKILV